MVQLLIYIGIAYWYWDGTTHMRWHGSQNEITIMDGCCKTLFYSGYIQWILFSSVHCTFYRSEFSTTQQIIVNENNGEASVQSRKYVGEMKKWIVKKTKAIDWYWWYWCSLNFMIFSETLVKFRNLQLVIVAHK